MSLRCVLVPSTSADDAGHRLAVGLGLCRRIEAHLRLLFVRPDAEEIYRALPDVICVTGVTASQIEAETEKEAARSRAAFAQFCAGTGIRGDGSYTNLPSVFGTWTERVGVVAPVVALAGRASDLIVINRPEPGDTKSERIFDAAAFSSGRPTLIVPERAPDDLLRDVVIAWNGSLEAARLVGHAMDLLRGADRVSILTAPPEPEAAQASADLEDDLMWHGIRTKSMPVLSAGWNLGADLLEAARRAVGHAAQDVLRFGAGSMYRSSW